MKHPKPPLTDIFPTNHPGGGIFTVVFLPLTIAVLATGCSWMKTDDSSEPAASDRQESSQITHAQVAGIPLAMLEKAGLHIQWQIRLPLARAKEIDRIFYHNGQLYALNNRNVLMAIDGQRGTIQWSTALAAYNLPCSEPTYYEDRLLFVLGSTVVEIRDTDGKKTLPQEVLQLDFPVSTTVARTDDYLFVGSANKGFYCLTIDNATPVWKDIRTDVPFGNIEVRGNKVYFLRRNNVLYVSSIYARSLSWTFDKAEDAMPGVRMAGPQCLLPSLDTILYCLHPTTGRILWKHMAGGSLVELVVVTETAIYQPVQYRSLLCLNRDSDTDRGSPRWELPKGRSLLAENGSIVYAITTDDELVLMDNDKARRATSFYVPNINLYAANNEDATIFLGNKDGRIICLMPDKIEPPYTPK